MGKLNNSKEVQKSKIIRIKDYLKRKNKLN
jgi:hypothetical protein